MKSQRNYFHVHQVRVTQGMLIPETFFPVTTATG